jgi:hypothetical protein
VKTTTDRRAAIKQRAEELAVQLISGGLVTDDPALQGVVEKLRPFKARLGQINRDLVRKGLGMIEIDPSCNWEVEEGAKKALVDLVDKLWGMRLLFGIL